MYKPLGLISIIFWDIWIFFSRSQDVATSENSIVVGMAKAILVIMGSFLLTVIEPSSMNYASDKVLMKLTIDVGHVVKIRASRPGNAPTSQVNWTPVELRGNVVFADTGHQNLSKFVLYWPQSKFVRYYVVHDENTIAEYTDKPNKVKFATWTLIRKSILGVAVIANVDNKAKQSRLGTFINTTFTDEHIRRRVEYWEPFIRTKPCPTPSKHPYSDSKHNTSKVLAITLSHYVIWQEFWRLHSWSVCPTADCDPYLVIFEGDAQCGVQDCGAVTAQVLRTSKSDIVYLGWCDGFKRIRDDAKKQLYGPPYCTHAYAITARAAKILIDNVVFCTLPLDKQMRDLGTRRLITWEKASLRGLSKINVTLDVAKRQGSEGTEGIFHQDW